MDLSELILLSAPQRRWLRATLLTVLATLPILACATEEIAFPGEQWERRTPREMGIDPAVLTGIEEHMKDARANGVLIRNGYLIEEWNYGGPADQRFDVQSCTKAITSLMLGLALKDGKISSLDAKVKDYYPDLEVGPYTDEITFRHLVTATSGIEARRWNYVDPGNMQPGVELRYHNEHTSELAGALTYIYAEDLEKILRERVLDKIGADMEWRSTRGIEVADGHEVRVVAGYAFSRWAARALARVGWLHLNGGNWDGEQILLRDYVEECMTPVPLPVEEWRDPWTRGDTSLLR